MNAAAWRIAPDDDAMTALCETDLQTFVEQAWPIVVPAEPYQDNWHIGAICEHLEALYRREIYNLLINVPPRFGKSVLGSVMFPAWNWIQDATYRMVYSSYSQRLSTRDSLATRRLLESSWYRQRWADRFVITTDQNEKTLFENDKKGFRLATSVGGVATGEGGDLVAVDDPHNVNEAESETVRQGVLDWWNITMPTRTGRAGRASRLVIMQRINEGDLSGDIITKGNYVHLCIPMEYESKFTKKAWNGWTDPRTEDGELAWKERFTEEVITATLRPPNMSSVAYAGQMQQRPAPAEGGMFKRGWWKYHRLAAEVLIAKADDKCWSWDMAFKDLDDSDYVAGLAWVRVGGDMYLLPHKVHERIGFSASKAAVKTCAAKYPGVHYKLVEDKANGTAVIDDLRHSVGGLVAIEPQGGKEARASVMQPYVEAGNIWLPDPMDAPWIEDYIEEFRVFPNGNNDDYVDASTQAIVWMLNRMVKGFAPIVTSFTRSTAMSDGAPRFRDPRYGDEPLEVPAGYSERGDMPRPPRRPTAEHNFEDNVHRTECRGCRVAWKRAHAPAPIKPVLVSV